MTCQERGGAGTLQLIQQDRRLAYWRYTPAAVRAAHRFAARFKIAKCRSASRSDTPAVCPSCGALITSDDGVCVSCIAVPAPSTFSSLYRLIGFARPWKGIILLGFFLTVAGTGVGLIATYFTKPLTDNVLVPYQSGKQVDWNLAIWYLAGLCGAAVLTWLLEWLRTYVLAWVSERVVSDLRTKTYSHLQWLSLEFFGGKRTGDLISRIGSDTDKICSFLSVNLVSFAADVLMILMTAMVLISIDVQLAIAALVPFPLIMWLVHWVRIRLRRGFRQANVALGEMTSVLADTIPGIRVVKAFAQEGARTSDSNAVIDAWSRSTTG